MGENIMKFTIGTVYSRISQFIAQDFSLLLGILVMTYSLPIFAVTYMSAQLGDPSGMGVVTSLAEFFATTFNLCLVAFLAEARQSGTPFKLGKAAEAARSNLLPLFGVSIVTGFIIILGTILLIVPGIIATIGLCVAAPAYIYEKRTGITDAARRSWTLTQNHRLIIAGIYLPLIVGFALIIALLVILPERFDSALLMSTISTVSGSIVTFVTCVFSVIIYTSLREVKEGQTPAVTAAVFD